MLSIWSKNRIQFKIHFCKVSFTCIIYKYSTYVKQALHIFYYFIRKVKFKTEKWTFWFHSTLEWAFHFTFFFIYRWNIFAQSVKTKPANPSFLNSLAGNVIWFFILLSSFSPFYAVMLSKLNSKGVDIFSIKMYLI